MTHTLLHETTGTQEVKLQFSQVQCGSGEIYHPMKIPILSFKKWEDFHHNINYEYNAFVFSSLKENQTKMIK